MKKITPQMAHDEIVKSIGHYGWYALNDYHELRNIVLFGDRNKGYVPDLDKMLDGKTIDKALELMDGDLIVSIRPTNYDGWMLNILPMGRGYVNGTDFTMMNACFQTLDECIAAIGERMMKIFDWVFGTTRSLYVTGHNDAVEKAANIISRLIKKRDTTMNASDINTYIELILKGKHDEASKFINKR